MEKKELRKKYMKLRSQITEREYKSHLIAERLAASHYYRKADAIAFYSSFGSEVNTKEMIEKGLRDGKRIFLPKVIDERHMEFYEIVSLDEATHRGAFGIMEPENFCRKVSADEIELMVLPGLCFDSKKNRLGYGKGYYDRYLQNKAVLKIGLCFQEQFMEDEAILTDRTDIKMDAVITDKQLILF